MLSSARRLVRAARTAPKRQPCYRLPYISETGEHRLLCLQPSPPTPPEVFRTALGCRLSQLIPSEWCIECFFLKKTSVQVCELYSSSGQWLSFDLEGNREIHESEEEEMDDEEQEDFFGRLAKASSRQDGRASDDFIYYSFVSSLQTRP